MFDETSMKILLLSQIGPINPVLLFIAPNGNEQSLGSIFMVVISINDFSDTQLSDRNDLQQSVSAEFVSTFLE